VSLIAALDYQQIHPVKPYKKQNCALHALVTGKYYVYAMVSLYVEIQLLILRISVLVGISSLDCVYIKFDLSSDL